MPDPDVFVLRLEALAVAARLRRAGERDTADLVEWWAHSPDFADDTAYTGWDESQFSPPRGCC